MVSTSISNRFRLPKEKIQIARKLHKQEEEVEDIVGDVKYTDSQKSIATSNVYSMDFTDSGSDKNNSSGMETYVIEICDSEDGDTYPMHENISVISVNNIPETKRDAHIQCEDDNKVFRATPTSLHNCPVLAQEIFTQTSKTILELAQTELVKKTLETQTSFISITENKTVEYRIGYKNSIKNIENNVQISEETNLNYVLTNALEDDSSRFPVSDSETIKSDDDISEISSDDRIIKIIDKESKESDENDEVQYENTSDFEESNGSDLEDSLMEPRHLRIETDNSSDTSEVPQSVDGDIKELYNKLAESIDLQMDKPYEPDKRFNTLTPLTEESTVKIDNSLVDITPNSKNIAKSISDSENDVLFTNNAGVKVKMFPTDLNKDSFKLPPIQNRSCPNSPHLNLLFSLHTPRRQNNSELLPCLYEENMVRELDRWEIGTKDLASGESTRISGRSDASQEKDSIHLPPIHIEGYVVNSKISKNDTQYSNMIKITPSETLEDAISISEKILELKQKNKIGKKPRSKYNIVAHDTRSVSPSSESPDDLRLCDAAEKGSDVLCVELLRRLRSSSWFQVTNTLNDIPSVLERFWSVIAEHRIADLIRQVSVHVESPRTQVAQSACNTLASVLKNTNYTKKPDFYESITLLLTKTSSFSRPVRRAANVALDDIVSSVELSHAVTALCIHGTSHKSALVRCASVRLLVVCSALAGGGRGLLRVRPPSAAAARTHALRALAALLDDKDTDTRKYAERFYAMLRPLPNFEAYYLTDVNVETASRQMKKYDKLLCYPRQAK